MLSANVVPKRAMLSGPRLDVIGSLHIALLLLRHPYDQLPSILTTDRVGIHVTEMMQFPLSDIGHFGSYI